MQTKAEPRAERDHYKRLAEEGIMPRIKGMRFENGECNMEVVGPITEYIATAFICQFKAGGAENFMEMNFYDRDEPFQRYILTVQKVGAKSPADKLKEANAKLAMLVRALKPFAEAADGRRSKDVMGAIAFSQDYLLNAREAIAEAGQS